MGVTTAIRAKGTTGCGRVWVYSRESFQPSSQPPNSTVTETAAAKITRAAHADSSAPSQQTLAELARLIALQNEAALGELYEATVGRVFALARAILKNAADAEEIVIDTYTQVWQAAGTYDSTRGSVMGWLVTICRSRALDLLRRQQVRLRNSGAELESNRFDELLDSGPQDLLQAMQQNTAVHRALATLTPIRRRVLALAFFQGLSHQEIAEMTGLPVGTVKSHVRRALAALRLELSKEIGDVATSG